MTAQRWTRDELKAFQAIKEFLRGTAEAEPLSNGVADVIFAPDRQAVLGAVEHYPALLTDRGQAGFTMVALMAGTLGVPRVTEVIERARASIEALPDSRA